MGLESVTFISDLVSTNPVSTDLKSAGDDHLRRIKSALLNTFPLVTGAVSVTHMELNALVGVTDFVQDQIDSLSSTVVDYYDELVAADAYLTTTKQAVTTRLTEIVEGTLVAGYDATSYSVGTKDSGTFTPDPMNGNLQYAVNGGVHTLAPPTSDCSLVIQYTNNASAGAITTLGFTKVTGAAPGTTNGNDYLAYITRVNGFSHLQWQALQ